MLPTGTLHLAAGLETHLAHHSDPSSIPHSSITVRPMHSIDQTGRSPSCCKKSALTGSAGCLSGTRHSGKNVKRLRTNRQINRRQRSCPDSAIKRDPTEAAAFRRHHVNDSCRHSRIRRSTSSHKTPNRRIGPQAMRRSAHMVVDACPSPAHPQRPEAGAAVAPPRPRTAHGPSPTRTSCLPKFPPSSSSRNARGALSSPSVTVSR